MGIMFFKQVCRQTNYKQPLLGLHMASINWGKKCGEVQTHDLLLNEALRPCWTTNFHKNLSLQDLDL